MNNHKVKVRLQAWQQHHFMITRDWEIGQKKSLEKTGLLTKKPLATDHILEVLLVIDLLSYFGDVLDMFILCWKLNFLRPWYKVCDETSPSLYLVPKNLVPDWFFMTKYIFYFCRFLGPETKCYTLAIVNYVLRISNKIQL